MNRHLAYCDFDLRSRCCESSWMRVVVLLLVFWNKNMLCYVIQYNFQGQLGNVWRNALAIYTKPEVTLYVTHSSSGAFSGATKCAMNGYTFCRLRGDNLCRVWQNVPLRVHILSLATNCAGATKCAVTHHAIVSLNLRCQNILFTVSSILRRSVVDIFRYIELIETSSLWRHCTGSFHIM